jgi:hypothetical protein
VSKSHTVLAYIASVAATVPAPALAQGFKVNQRASTVPSAKAATAAPLSDILKRPDNEVVTAADGQTLTIGELKARIFKPVQISSTRTMAESSKVPMPSLLVAPTISGLGSSATLSQAVSQAKNLKADLLKTCDERGQPPSLDKVRGSITPGGVITISASCLKDARGNIRMFGNFPGGVYQLTAHHWGDNSIVTQIPADIRGIGSIPVRFEAITADRKAAKPITATLMPKMELVDVTAYWRGISCTDRTEARLRIQCANNSVYLHQYWGTGAFDSDGPPILEPAYEWSIQVNRSCFLNEAWWNKGRGDVKRLIGWDKGPPHESKVVAVPVLERWLDVHLTGDLAHSGFSYALGADAYCPVGISPQP